MGKVKALYIKAGSEEAPKIITVADDGSDLEELYRLLNCDTIDVTSRVIGGKYFNVICDDNGKLKSNQIPSGIHFVGTDMRIDLVGSLIITGEADADGNFLDLTSEDICILQKYLIGYQMANNRKSFCIVY